MEGNGGVITLRGGKMSDFYDKTLGICEKYLASGAKRFLDRQITMHLEKSPETLMPGDKDTLAKWCKTSGHLLLGQDKSEKLEKEILSV